MRVFDEEGMLRGRLHIIEDDDTDEDAEALSEIP